MQLFPARRMRNVAIAPRAQLCTLLKWLSGWNREELVDPAGWVVASGLGDGRGLKGLRAGGTVRIH